MQDTLANNPSSNNEWCEILNLDLAKLCRDNFFRKIYERIASLTDLVALKAQYRGNCLSGLFIYLLENSEYKIDYQVLLVEVAMNEIWKEMRIVKSH